ncbi:hypothetical protein ACS0TY_000384 [Phlomoides rotata]
MSFEHLLAATNGLLDILMSGNCLPTEQHAMITGIQKYSTAWIRLLNNILDLRKLDTSFNKDGVRLRLIIRQGIVLSIQRESWCAQKLKWKREANHQKLLSQKDNKMLLWFEVLWNVVHLSLHICMEALVLACALYEPW